MRKTEIKRSNPTQCIYWNEPKEIRSGPLRDRFELIETYVKNDQFWQYLLCCHECGQLYFMEFRESTDWVNGNDPQFTVYVPVEDTKDGAVVREQGCKNSEPRLHVDFPSEAEKPFVYWVAENSD